MPVDVEGRARDSPRSGIVGSVIGFSTRSGIVESVIGSSTRS